MPAKGLAGDTGLTDKQGAYIGPNPQVPFKLKVGAPTSYGPGVCDIVLKLGAEGASLAQMSAHLGVPRETLRGWANRHPEFGEALARAYDLSQSWWELYGRFAGVIPSFNATVWKKTMECRFRNEYTERKEHMVYGPDGMPVTQASIDVLDVELLEPEDREALKQLLLAARVEADADEAG